MSGVNPGNARIPYKVCPLCSATALKNLRKGNCYKHPSYHARLGGTIQWNQCSQCGHIFTDGYFTKEALDVLFSCSLAHQTPGTNIEAKRVLSAKTISTISAIRGASEGRWLDVGFGDGSLLTTAAEFGYAVSGIDLREVVVEKLCEFGYQDVYCIDFMEFVGLLAYDVLSMADLLEHLPYPGRALRHARDLLTDDGLLFISAPNMDSFVWRILDKQGGNPYWNEIEHYHNFSRERLYALLRETGFEPIHYDVSQRYRVCMEIVARKVGDN